MMRKRIAVTGSGGYIGSIMVEGLLRSGYRVKAIDAFFFGRDVLAQYSRHPYLEVVQRDIRSITHQDFEGCAAVIDMAALSNDPSGELDPELTTSINEFGRIRVARAAKRAGVRRYLFASSCAVYGAGEGMFLNEDAPLRPLTTYAQTCARAEETVLALSDPHFVATAMRNATVFGLSPRMRFDLVVNQMTFDAWKRGHIKVGGDGSQWRPFVHVRDVVKAFLAVLHAPGPTVAGEVFNIGWDNRRILDVALAVQDRVSPACTIEIVGSRCDNRDYHVDFSKYRRVVACNPSLSIDDGVAEILTSLRSGELIESIRCYTVKWYAELLRDARSLLHGPSLDLEEPALITTVASEVERLTVSARSAAL